MIKCYSSLIPKNTGGLVWIKCDTKDVVVTSSYSPLECHLIKLLGPRIKAPSC